ncbi:MAG: SGNH/GDSL hydrolase family protein [Candidatus Tectimicrobiota bacterium]
MQCSTLWPSQRNARTLGRFSGPYWRTLMISMMLGFSVAPWPAQAQRFRDVVVVGDSLADIGNVLAITRTTPQPIPASPPYASGRFTNGPVWVEHLAQRFGVRLSPSLAGGLNFAFGGAEIDVDRRDVLEFDIGVTVSSLLTQADAFRLTQLIDDVDPATLFVVWGGANDLRDALRSKPDPMAEARDAVQALGEVIRTLADEDAVYFLVPNVPDLSRTPEINSKGPQAVAQARAVSMAFNQALEMTLATIETERQVHIARLDTFTRVAEVMAQPAAFGFTNVTEACLAGDYVQGGTACATPATYLFWDQLHPTTAAHALLAQFAADVLPPLVVTPGPNNADETPQVSLPTQNLPVLQARLSTGEEAVTLRSITLESGRPMQQATRVQTLRLRISQDSNGNGSVDAGEPVLATAELPGATGTLPLTLPTPFTLPANSTTHLVVSLDINSPASTAALQSPAPTSVRTAQSTPRPSLALLLPLLSLCATLRLRRGARLLGVLLLCSALLLSSCNSEREALEDIVDGDDDSRNAFVVVMPALGSMAQGAASGLFAFPPATITGSTVRINP